ncbi:MAG: S1 RNA-binding domain-containing protein, partial [Methylibium sp.]
GEEFGGAVTAVTTFGLFVTLDELYVEGLVHITELGGEYFRFDEARQELRGERTGVRYVVGSRVRVQVSRVDLDGRKIDFRLVHESGLNPRAPRDKAASAVEELQVVKDVDREHKRATKKAVSKTPRKPARSAGADTAAAPRKSKRSRR